MHTDRVLPRPIEQRVAIRNADPGVISVATCVTTIDNSLRSRELLLDGDLTTVQEGNHPVGNARVVIEILSGHICLVVFGRLVLASIGGVGRACGPNARGRRSSSQTTSPASRSSRIIAMSIFAGLNSLRNCRHVPQGVGWATFGADTATATICRRPALIAALTAARSAQIVS